MIFGLSLRRGPYDWDAADLAAVADCRFAVWDVPTWMAGDPVMPLRRPTRLIASDLFSYAELTNIAEGSDKMFFDLAAVFAVKLNALKTEGVRAVTFDVGLAVPPEDVDEETLDNRFRLLRVLWQTCFNADVRLFLPVSLPFESEVHERWAQTVIRRAMCAGLQFIADVHVHKILRVPDLPQLLHRVGFDLGAVRLCWNAEEGNAMRPEWFAPWFAWAEAHPRVPVLFEPTLHHLESFLRQARSSAVMCGVIREDPGTIPLR